MNPQTDLFITRHQPAAERVALYFDGGTPCNIPARGYGIGYGSYQYAGAPVVRVNHGRPMSANAAEIWTLVEGLNASSHRDVLIVGDSQIALKWADVCAGNPFGRPKKNGKHRRAKMSKDTSWEMRDAVDALKLAVAGRNIRTQWRGRDASVEQFGH